MNLGLPISSVFPSFRPTSVLPSVWKFSCNWLINFFWHTDFGKKFPLGKWPKMVKMTQEWWLDFSLDLAEIVKKKKKKKNKWCWNFLQKLHFRRNYCELKTRCSCPINLQDCLILNICGRNLSLSSFTQRLSPRKHGIWDYHFQFDLARSTHPCPDLPRLTSVALCWTGTDGQIKKVSEID